MHADRVSESVTVHTSRILMILRPDPTGSASKTRFRMLEQPSVSHTDCFFLDPCIKSESHSQV